MPGSGSRVRRARGAASPRRSPAARPACPSASTRPSLSTMIWSARRRAARRCETTRQVDVAAGRTRRSQSSALGLDVQRAGQVVHDQQLGVAHEHARRRGALDLPARQLHAARPDARVAGPSSSVGMSRSSTAASTAAGQIRPSPSGRPSRMLSLQRLAEQARHLGRVGAARRHEEGGRVGHRRAVPADRARVARQQARAARAAASSCRRRCAR